MDDIILEAILTILAALATIGAAWYKGKNKEAGAQGDVILNGFKWVISIGEAISPLVPELKEPLSKLKVIVMQIEIGWNDSKFTTDEMKVLYEQGAGLKDDILKLIGKKTI